MSDSPAPDFLIRRLPADLRERILASAQRNGRSMNGEVLAALERAFPAPGQPSDVAEAQAALEVLRRVLGAKSGE